MEARIAVAIVHYRAEELCAQCVQRLRDSSVDDFHAVIVDNGSTTGLRGLDDDPRFRISRPGHNLGYAAGITPNPIPPPIDTGRPPIVASPTS